MPVSIAIILSASLQSQSAPPAPAPDAPQTRTAPVAAPAAKVEWNAAELREATARGTEILLSMQENHPGGPDPEGVDGPCEWPYEGVYRVAGKIPIGYRIGGTAIAGMALLAGPSATATVANQPDAEAAARRTAALARACRFVCVAADDPLMDPDYEGGYDVRGWGHCYALQFLLRLKQAEAIPEEVNEEVEKRILQYIAALEAVEIPEVGGWNYARAPQRRPSPASPFMTGPALQALFLSRELGYTVSDAVVERGIKALERCRTASGSFAYSAAKDASAAKDGTPGAVGRMLVAESTLLLAGRGSVPQVRAALDAFIAHWARLEERRAKPGTHLPPFGVAPYYFYFAHTAAAQAIELIPAHERPEYRQRLLELIFRTRAEDGSWNDRVFPRSAAYGTAMSILAITMPEGPAQPRWVEKPE